MLININHIKINPGRREAVPEDVQRLSESVAEVGMMNPITVTADHTLIAGLHRLEPEQQRSAAKRLTDGTIKSVDEYTAGDTATMREDHYYCTGAFIVDTFLQQNNALGHVPEAYKLRLDHYREILSPEQIKTMIGIAKGSIKMLQDYVAFLNNELEVSE